MVYRTPYGAELPLIVLDLLHWAWREGRMATLDEVQDAVLVAAWLRLARHISPGGQDGRTMRAANHRMMAVHPLPITAR